MKHSSIKQKLSAFFSKKYSLLLHLEYKSQPVDYVEDEKQNWEGDQKELVNPKIKELVV